MIPEPGPAFWEAREEDDRRRAKIRTELKESSTDYLQGVVDQGKPFKRLLAARALLREVNPFNYGSSTLYEPHERLRMASEILVRRDMADADDETVLATVDSYGTARKVIDGVRSFLLLEPSQSRVRYNAAMSALDERTRPC